MSHLVASATQSLMCSVRASATLAPRAGAKPRIALPQGGDPFVIRSAGGKRGWPLNLV